MHRAPVTRPMLRPRASSTKNMAHSTAQAAQLAAIHQSMAVRAPSRVSMATGTAVMATNRLNQPRPRSEEHTSELQSQSNLVCRLLLEKKKKKTKKQIHK